MKKTSLLIVLIALVATTTVAQMRIATGKVTYIAAGTVYTSLGRESGIQDSSMIYVRANGDMIAVLQVFAVSSNSSASRILSSKRSILVGSIVVASVSERNAILPTPEGVSERPIVPTDTARVSTDVATSRSKSASNSSFELKGRVSAQYYTNRYENTGYIISQPGIVLDLHGRLTEFPLQFDLYTNFRTIFYGGASPFSRNTPNQSRIYRLSLGYDDGANAVSIGRIIPSFAPSLGFIDGALFSRRFWWVTVGTALGFQPSYTLRGVAPEYKKFAVFLRLQPPKSGNFSLTSAYSRSYFRSQLEREAASFQMNILPLSGFLFFAQTEVDVRRKSGDRLVFAPSLTSLYLNVSYRLTTFFNLGIGADASRPFYNFSSIRETPDSLLERRLRSGVNVNASLSLPGGIMLYNTYTPRTSESNFARAYSDYAAVSFTDILSSGISLRSNLNLSANDYTTSRGYGLNLQKNVATAIDVNVRYQWYHYILKKSEERHESRSFGADLMISVSRLLAVVMSYDRLEGIGAKSSLIFAEMSVRF